MPEGVQRSELFVVSEDSSESQAANKKIKELIERKQAAPLIVNEVHLAKPVPNVSEKIVEEYM
jgi:hypothetical protein